MSVAAAPAPAPGILGWVGATDHKRVAVLTGATALGFFLASGILALLVRTELAAPGLQLLSRDAYNQVFSMHGSGMIYLVVTPLALALGVYLVPLQVGAAEIAWPRLTQAGYWLFLAGGVTMYAGFVTQHGAGKDGWTAYYPLSDLEATPGTGMDFWIFGVVLATAGVAVQAAAVLATVLRLRAPGMKLLHLPVFTWSMVATCVMVVTSFPVLIAAMALLFADRHITGVYDSTGGPIAYQHLFWFYAHPVVYVMFFPFLGAVAEVVSVFAARRFFGYKATVLSLMTFAALSMSVWGHHTFTTGQVDRKYFSLTSTILLITSGTEYFAVIGTLIGGSIVFSTAMLFGLGFILLFLLGGLSGIVIASPPLDYDLHETFFIVAHFHYTLFAGSMFGLFAAVYYWFPKVTGVLLGERLGKLHFWLLAVGTNLTFFPMFIVGYEGMRRRIADYPQDAGWATLNGLATAGAFVVALGILVFLINLAVSLRRRERAGDDPWAGHTLEWATSSPPPRYNFDALPEIRSNAPLLDLREEMEAR